MSMPFEVTNWDLIEETSKGQESQEDTPLEAYCYGQQASVYCYYYYYYHHYYDYDDYYHYYSYYYHYHYCYYYYYYRYCVTHRFWGRIP